MRVIRLLSSLLFISFVCQAQQSAISFRGGGRFGDKLYAYSRAKWLAQKYNLTFLCPKFKFRAALALDDLDPKLTPKTIKSFSEVRIIKHESQIKAEENDILYIMKYSSFLKDEKKVLKPIDRGLIYIMFNKDREFLAHLKSCIKPKMEIPQLALPTNMPTIAVHVRRGCGRDEPLLQKRKITRRFSDQHYPTKFPPSKFYTDQIRRVASLYNPDQPIYVHIFTDDKDPQAIIENYQQTLALPNLIFEYRKDNDYKDHILDDLFGMTQFDYLIHPTSSFSWVAMTVGNHKICISPKQATWYDDYLSIDSILILERQSDGSITQALIETPEFDDLLILNSHTE